MGTAQSGGQKVMPEDEQHASFDLESLDLRDSWLDTYRPDALMGYSILQADISTEFKRSHAALRGEAGAVEDSCIGSVIGLAIGDALGSPVEFSKVDYERRSLKYMGQPEFWEIHPDAEEGRRAAKNSAGYNSFGLKPGQWTDDTAMSLCLADSLLVHSGLEPKDLRLRFLNWWHFGYNNAFALDPGRQKGEPPASVGLGGNIGASLREFMETRGDFKASGDKLTSGNGSLMRLAPCAVFARTEVDAAMTIAAKQSLTTHLGDEAAELCRLLAFLLVPAYGRMGDTPAHGKSIGGPVSSTAKATVAGRTVASRSKAVPQPTTAKPRGIAKIMSCFSHHTFTSSPCTQPALLLSVILCYSCRLRT
eukprot:TRINITY_DN16980_c0_g1_i1.p1 TRINITY_DN16980_c0_g1~~TRINITY_DN16980_c0_g1_i1.p1  ORF type:complete len:364 (+),score=41.99 TRINITY_DN16980_c0_g1_i1:72-1163(+)